MSSSSSSRPPVPSPLLSFPLLFSPLLSFPPPPLSRRDKVLLIFREIQRYAPHHGALWRSKMGSLRGTLAKENEKPLARIPEPSGPPGRVTYPPDVMGSADRRAAPGPIRATSNFPPRGTRFSHGSSHPRMLSSRSSTRVTLSYFFFYYNTNTRHLCSLDVGEDRSSARETPDRRSRVREIYERYIYF